MINPGKITVDYGVVGCVYLVAVIIHELLFYHFHFQLRRLLYRQILDEWCGRTVAYFILWKFCFFLNFLSVDLPLDKVLAAKVGVNQLGGHVWLVVLVAHDVE
jgi:hypothetical protein